MAADGSDVQETSPALSYIDVWSPDGLYMAVRTYASGRGFVLHTVRVSDGKWTKIGNTVTKPTWSPDSRKLAFGSFDSDGHIRINSVGHDGSNSKVVVDLGDQVVEYYPDTLKSLSWSPDGSDILYVYAGFDTRRVFGRRVCVAGADGGDVRVLIPEPADSQYYASWSPDGSRIAVHEGAEWNFGAYEIRKEARPDIALFTMARDGSDVRVLVRDKRVRLEAENSLTPTPTVSEDIGSCSAGDVVPNPADNPGLVSDCETLLSLRDALGGSLVLDWGPGKPIAYWEGNEPQRRVVVEVELGLLDYAAAGARLA